ncbi:MAG TPA: phosphodiester glycosidase family protein [Bacteroidota bacterium]|nr:phosphodiester glycosidase family protein [Bacteroidota bacterium]
MKTICALIIAGLVSTGALYPQVRYDTLVVHPVGPGMTHYRIVAASVPWNINVLKIDLKNPFVTMETVKANDRLVGVATTSSMAGRKSSAGHVVVGAVNGDFFNGDGSPTNVQVAQGEILTGTNGRPLLGFTPQNAPMISSVTVVLTARLPDTVATIQNVNVARGSNALILYNSYMGTSTGTSSSGTEALLRPVGSWIVNDTVVCVVDSIVVNVGNLGIPAGKAVLSGSGTRQSLVMARLSKGDTVRLFQGLQPGLRRLKEVVGGYPPLVSGGVNVALSSVRDFRTGVGFSADSSTLYFVTVDKVGATSAGMSFAELADFMIFLGVSTGVNLDGGGSTTMVVRGADVPDSLSVVNTLPDFVGERMVGNALLAVSSAPTGPLASVILSTPRLRISRGNTFQYAAYGLDQYGNPVYLDPWKMWFTADPQIGTIGSLTGTFKAGEHFVDGFVHLTYEGHHDSAFVRIKRMSILDLQPTNIVTDTSRKVTFHVANAYNEDGVLESVAPTEYTWSVTDASVGVVDSTGTFKGKKTGTTKVIVHLQSAADTAIVKVQIAATYRSLDSFESLDSWSLGGQNIDLANTHLSLATDAKTLDNASLKVDYSFTGNPSLKNYVYLDTYLGVYGVPDSIIVDARSDSGSHRISCIVTDDNGEAFRAYSTTYANRAGAFDTLLIDLASPQSVTGTGTFNFPITITRIEIELGSPKAAGVVYTGTFYLDNLRVSYPVKTTTGATTPLPPIPSDYILYPNYPNPFNPSTEIRFSLPHRDFVKLTIFDVIGRNVATLVSGELQAGTYSTRWNASGFPSGVYFYRLQTRGFVETRKLLLIR